MIGWGHFFRVSGLGHQVPGSGIQVRVQVQEICHPSSVIDSVLNFGSQLCRDAVPTLPRGSLLK